MSKVPKYIAIKYMCEILYKKIKGMQCSKVSKIHCTDFNALNGIFVRDVRDGVCGFYATLYAEYRFHVGDVKDTLYSVLCIQWPLAPPGGKAHCSHTIHPVGLAVHHHAVRGGSFVLKCILGLVKLHG